MGIGWLAPTTQLMMEESGAQIKAFLRLKVRLGSFGMDLHGLQKMKLWRSRRMSTSEVCSLRLESLITFIIMI